MGPEPLVEDSKYFLEASSHRETELKRASEREKNKYRIIAFNGDV